MPNKGDKITPHKGGRTQKRLLLMTPEVKELTDYVLAEMTKRAGFKLSLSDMWEFRVRAIAEYLRNNPDLPPVYTGMKKIHTGRLDPKVVELLEDKRLKPADAQAKKAHSEASSD